MKFWNSCFSTANNAPMPKSYVGVYQNKYGKDYDLESLCRGNLDDSFKTIPLNFKLKCKVFSSQEEALTEMERIGVTDKSSYVLVMGCAPDLLEVETKSRNFSELILGAINPRERPFKFYGINEILNRGNYVSKPM